MIPQFAEMPTPKIEDNLFYSAIKLMPNTFSEAIKKDLTAKYTATIKDKLIPQYKKMTGSLIAGVQNLTNRKNPVRQYYDSGIGGIRYNYLLALIPVVGYKIDF